MVSDRTPLTEIEQAIVKKLATASFPPATASKRFAHNLSDGYVKDLSDKGRRFLAYVVHRFRRQYSLSREEQEWVSQWSQPVPEQPAETIVVEPSLPPFTDDIPSAQLCMF